MIELTEKEYQQLRDFLAFLGGLYEKSDSHKARPCYEMLDKILDAVRPPYVPTKSEWYAVMDEGYSRAEAYRAIVATKGDIKSAVQMLYDEMRTGISYKVRPEESNDDDNL